jgi:hypothetical protein
VYTLGTWLLLATVRPRSVLPACKDVLAALNDQVGRHLVHNADLVLAWCWAHPARLQPTAQSPAPTGELAGSFWDALGTLRAAVSSPASRLDDLAESALAVLQRAEEEGYEWKSLPRGTPYDAAMASLFSNFGVIDVGQPVETLKPATVRDGVAVQQGVIRRLRL